MTGRGRDQREIAAMRKFIYRAAGFGPQDRIPEGYDAHDAVADAGRRLRRIDELEERMDQIEHGFGQVVTDLPTTKRGKREKMYAVVAHAVENGKQGTNGVTISRDAAAGAAGCSDRHALNLFDDLEDGYEWANKDLSRSQARLKIELGDRSTSAFMDALTADFPEATE